MLDSPEPVELRTLDELAFRREVFATLLTRANGALEPPELGADPEFDRELAEDKWAGDPLCLMMAGLVAAEAGVQATLSLSRTDLALSVARNELDRIGKIGASRGIDKHHRHPGAFVRHMAVMATLVQGLTGAEALALAVTERAALGSAAEPDATIEALTDALPESDASDSVAPILPDIVGEGAILAWLGPNGGIGGGRDAQPRIAAAARVSMPKVSSTLVRTAQDFAAAGHAEPVRWLEAFVGAPENDVGALIKIADVLPIKSLALGELAVALYMRIGESLRGTAAAEAAAGSEFRVQSLYATSLSNLGNRLRTLGRLEEALAAAQEGVEIYRRLAENGSEALLNRLAPSINIFGIALRDLGRFVEALRGRVRGIRRDLSAAFRGSNRQTSWSNFALSLNTLGSVLGDLGFNEASLRATQEAVDIFLGLPPDNRNATLAASTLISLGKCLNDMGRTEDAVTAAREAVEIYRRLSAGRSDAFLPDLAKSLNNLGNGLSRPSNVPMRR